MPSRPTTTGGGKKKPTPKPATPGTVNSALGAQESGTMPTPAAPAAPEAGPDKKATVIMEKRAAARGEKGTRQRFGVEQGYHINKAGAVVANVGGQLVEDRPREVPPHVREQAEYDSKVRTAWQDIWSRAITTVRAEKRDTTEQASTEAAVLASAEGEARGLPTAPPADAKPVPYGATQHFTSDEALLKATGGSVTTLPGGSGPGAGFRYVMDSRTGVVIGTKALDGSYWLDAAPVAGPKDVSLLPEEAYARLGLDRFNTDEQLIVYPRDRVVGLEGRPVSIGGNSIPIGGLRDDNLIHLNPTGVYYMAHGKYPPGPVPRMFGGPEYSATNYHVSGDEVRQYVYGS